MSTHDIVDFWTMSEQKLWKVVSVICHKNPKARHLYVLKPNFLLPKTVLAL